MRSHVYLHVYIHVYLLAFNGNGNLFLTNGVIDLRQCFRHGVPRFNVDLDNIGQICIFLNLCFVLRNSAVDDGDIGNIERNLLAMADLLLFS